jgi:hypothetical protein
MVMANPSKAGETDMACCAAQQKSRTGVTPHGFLKRLPIARFRRSHVNRRNPNWLHPNVIISAGIGDPRRPSRSMRWPFKGMAMAAGGR